jgi:hypothetical protein
LKFVREYEYKRLSEKFWQKRIFVKSIPGRVSVVNNQTRVLTLTSKNEGLSSLVFSKSGHGGQNGLADVELEWIW